MYTACFQKLFGTAVSAAHRRCMYGRRTLKPNSITLASSELAPNMFEAGSCQITLH